MVQINNNKKNKEIRVQSLLFSVHSIDELQGERGKAVLRPLLHRCVVYFGFCEILIFDIVTHVSYFLGLFVKIFSLILLHWCPIFFFL